MEQILQAALIQEHYSAKVSSKNSFSNNIYFLFFVSQKLLSEISAYKLLKKKFNREIAL